MGDNYGTVQGYKDYCFARNNLHAHDADDQILAALLVASEWVDARYRTSFPGLKVGQRSQVREWPREGAVDIYGYVIPANAVPDEVERATYEATHRELDNPGSLSTDYTPSKYKSVSISGAVSAEYMPFDSVLEAQTQVMIVTNILEPILTGSRAKHSSYAGTSFRS